MQTKHLQRARGLLVLLLLTMLPTIYVWGDSPIVINNSAVTLGTSYSNTEDTFKVDNITFGYKNLIKNSKNTPSNWAANQVIQWKKNASQYGQLYNTDAISGLTKIRIYAQSGTNYDIYAGTSKITSKPSTGKIDFPSSKTGTETVTVNHKDGGTLSVSIDYYDISLGSGNSYFYIGTNNTATCYMYKLEIYYSSGTSVNLTTNSGQNNGSVNLIQPIENTS